MNSCAARRRGGPAQPQGDLVKEDEDVEDDQPDGDEGKGPARDVVLERKHRRARRLSVRAAAS